MVTAYAEAKGREIQKMRRDRHAGVVGSAWMIKHEVAVVHRKRQCAARRKLPTDHLLDMRHHRPQRRHREMQIGEALVIGAVGAEERLVELEQHHRTGPHGEFAAAMNHQRHAASGIARETIAVVVGLKHLAVFAPHRGEGAVTAADQGGADVDGIHRGAKWHIGGRIKFASVGKMLEQLREAEKTLPENPWDAKDNGAQFAKILDEFRALNGRMASFEQTVLGRLEKL